MASHPPRPQARTPLPKLALLALLSLAVAGCQLVPRPGPAERVPDSTPERPQTDRLANYPAGETRNLVAVLVPLSGPNAAVGRSIANAAELAIADTGSEAIRVTTYDTSPGAPSAAARAIAEGNGLILGPLLADEARAVAPMAQRADVPVIAFSNDVAAAGGGVYLMGLNPAQSVDRVVAHARAQGATRFGALVGEGLYGERVRQAMEAAVRAAGGRLVGTETYAATGIAPAAERLAARGQLDAVLIDSPRAAARLAPLLRRTSPQLRILGTELWAQESARGAVAPLRGAWFARPSDAMFDQLRTRYRARFRSNPYRLASLGYDAVLLAIRASADWQPGRVFPERRLLDSDGFLGIDGVFRFRRSGIVERALQIEEVTAEGTRIVSPAPRGFGG